MPTSEPDKGDDVLSVRDLVVQRGGKTVLHGVSLDIPAGQITALIGANGAGKSTTVMAIAGAIPVDAGRIEVDGVSLCNRRPEEVRAAGVAVVPEGHHVLGDLSVLDNLRAAAAILPKGAVNEQIERVLVMLPELRAKLADRGHALSGGQKQMVCIAQALVAMPRYLVIDELSLGLSPVVIKRLADIVMAAVRLGVGVLLIEQFTTLALRVSSRACVLERGRMVFTGASDDLLGKPEILHASYLAAKTSA